MGSWDETCALSNLGIRCGQRCVRVELKKTPEWFTERLYSQHDIHKYILRIIKGEYTDYGDVDGISPLDESHWNIYFDEEMWNTAIEIMGGPIPREEWELDYKRNVELIDTLISSIERLNEDLNDKEIAEQIEYFKSQIKEPVAGTGEFMTVKTAAFLWRRSVLVPPWGPQFGDEEIDKQVALTGKYLQRLKHLQEQYNKDMEGN